MKVIKGKSNKRQSVREMKNAGYCAKTYITFLLWRKTRKKYDYNEHGD